MEKKTSPPKKTVQTSSDSVDHIYLHFRLQVLRHETIGVAKETVKRFIDHLVYSWRTRSQPSCIPERFGTR